MIHTDSESGCDAIANDEKSAVVLSAKSHTTSVAPDGTEYGITIDDANADVSSK